MRIRAKYHGFTLVEVMVVLVILGILTAVALPMYQETTRKSRRSEAMRELMELASRQERFYAQNSTYTNEIVGELGLNWQSEFTSNQYYQLFVFQCVDEADFSRCYVLEARPQDDQAEDQCGVLWVDSQGRREANGPPGYKCW